MPKNTNKYRRYIAQSIRYVLCDTNDIIFASLHENTYAQWEKLLAPYAAEWNELDQALNDVE